MTAAAILAQDPVVTVASLLTLPPIVYLLWSKGEPPVLLASCAMQWLQIVTGVAYSAFNGSSIQEMFGIAQIEKAVWLSLVGILVLAGAMRLGLKRPSKTAGAEMAEEVNGIVLERAFLAWLVAFGVASIAAVSSGSFGGLSQVIYAVTGLKWVFCFILAYAVLTRNAGYALLCVAIALEFVTGSLGFFAGFKEVFFMVFLAALCTPRRLTGRARALLGMAIVIVMSASLIWTAVKKEYRLAQTTGEEEARSTKLLSLVAGLDANDLRDAAEGLVLRVEYLQYFAYTLDHVPDVVPYERGELWKGAVLHVVMPRAFFPDKAAIDDSERTMKYAGVWVAGADQGTSIGMGYMAESYVDFGPYLMFAPIFLLGVFMGLIYRFFAYRNPSRLMGSAIATAVLFPMLQAFATSNVKIVGGTIMSCLVFVGFERFVSAPALRWMTQLPPSQAARRAVLLRPHA